MIGICTNCKQPCEVGIIDNGIGAYEFWGAKYTDIQLEAVSDCCEDTAVDRYNNVITVEMVKDDNRASFI